MEELERELIKWVKEWRKKEGLPADICSYGLKSEAGQQNDKIAFCRMYSRY